MKIKAPPPKMDYPAAAQGAGQLSEEEKEALSKAEEEKKALQEMLEQLDRRRQFLYDEKDTVGFLERYSYSNKPGSIKLSSKPTDSAAGLTSRLVAATNELQVNTLISEAHSNLINLRLIAALGEGDDAQRARAYIGKLEKLIKRARIKVHELRNEYVIKIRQRKAEQNQQDRRAEQIKAELRRKRLARTTKENSYLIDVTRDYTFGSKKANADQGFHDAAAKLDTASEVSIAAEAQAVAAAEAAGDSVAVGGSDVATGGNVDITVSGVANDGSVDVTV